MSYFKILLNLEAMIMIVSLNYCVALTFDWHLSIAAETPAKFQSD